MLWWNFSISKLVRNKITQASKEKQQISYKGTDWHQISHWQQWYKEKKDYSPWVQTEHYFELVSYQTRIQVERGGEKVWNTNNRAEKGKRLEKGHQLPQVGMKGAHLKHGCGPVGGRPSSLKHCHCSEEMLIPECTRQTHCAWAG